jgi:quercetin dioxygenase-like cupin family protein
MFRKALLCASIVAVAGLGTVLAQQPPAGIKRTPLQKIEFPEGYTTVTGIAEIGPGGAAGRHTHPGIETGYVLEGEADLLIDGKPA